jgi:hypothetical protein
MRYLIYETTGKRPDDHQEIQADTNRDALAAFSSLYQKDGYISQAAHGRRYVFTDEDGGIWIADAL